MIKKLRNNWGLIFVLILSLFVIWPLLQSGYFSHHDDLHVIRIFEMRRCLSDLQIPCRWIPDMGNGFGYPLFNYYNPFVYYLGAILSFVLGFVSSAKVLFLIALLLGPVAIYFLGRELWGKTAGVVSSVIFMFAPYRALDAYVRGALAELLAISLVPLIFLFIFRLVKFGKIKDFIALTVILAIFLITHNVSVVIWAPFLFLWVLYSLYSYGNKNIKLLTASVLLAAGLSGFFVLPAVFEKSLVTADSLTSGDLNYNVHFAAIRELFIDRFWGYGASRQGPIDDLSLQIGWPHWWVIITILLVGVYQYLKKKKILPLTVVVFLIFFVVSVFMTHNKSAFVWDSFKLLSFLQFPWRFLAVSVFSASLLGGFLVSLGTGKIKYAVLMLLIIVSVLLNFSYFRPQNFLPNVNDDTKLSGDLWQEQTKGAILDYLPITAVDPKNPAPELPLVTNWLSDIKSFNKTSNTWTLWVNAQKESDIEIPVFNFPNWEANYPLSTNKYGRITLTVTKGEHKIEAKFKNTPIRTIANLISALSFVLLALSVYYAKSRKFFN